MRHLTFLPILIIFFVFSSCKKENDPLYVNVTANEPDSLPAVTLYDVAYAEYERNFMDVFLPENRNSKTPVLILVHGGSWSSGDKSSMHLFANIFTQTYGVATVCINYRLIPANPLPAQMIDIQAVVNKIRQQQPTWHVSKENIYMFGVSAGAHLSLLYSYGYDNSHNIKGVISMCGPTNFDLQGNITEHEEWYSTITALTGNSYEENSETWQHASPYFFVNSEVCPTILAHCEDDEIVPYDQAVMLKEKLESYHADVQFFSYPQGGHTFQGVNLETFTNACTQMVLKR